METCLVSYATENFERVRSELVASAVGYGINHLFSYGLADLVGSRYYTENRAILDRVCGAGYWAWKPYFIHQALERADDGDVLFYVDAGSRFVLPPDPLINICRARADGILLFDCRPLINSQFTKRDCFIRLGADTPRVWGANKVIATMTVFRKCGPAIDFVARWLEHCRDAAAITDDPNVCGQADLPDFVQHRWDQAILSVMAAQYGLETYRSPTKWANFLKMKPYRVMGEEVVSPYGLPPHVHGYSRHPQANSPYGTIFEINRQPNFVGKAPLDVKFPPATGGVQDQVRRIAKAVVRRVTRRLGSRG